MKKLFGTDGVRGLANAELSPLIALKLGTTAAHVLIEDPSSAPERGAAPAYGRTRGRATMLIGRDPRIS
ncbi:MAG: phosphoglucosamine mutase, partial [Armatimonadota bacterium]